MRRRAALPLSTLGGTIALGAACVTWAAAYEVRAFRLRRFEVPVLEPGQRPLRVLQVSDLHLVPSQRRKIEWVRALAGLEPESRWADWHGSPFTSESERHVSVWRKPE